MPNNGDTNLEGLSEVLEPRRPDKRTSFPLWWLTAIGIVVSLVVLVLCVVGLFRSIHDKPAPTDPNATALQERGFENVEQVPGKEGRYWASVQGFNSQCKFTFYRNDAGEWVLTRAASSRGYGDFTLENPNAAQLQAQFPDLLAGCELNAAPASPSATG